MKRLGFKTAQSIYDMGLETDRKALAVIKDLGLKEGQQITENHLCELVANTFGENSDAVLADLLGSVHLEPSYTIKMRAKRDNSDLLTPTK